MIEIGGVVEVAVVGVGKRGEKRLTGVVERELLQRGSLFACDTQLKRSR